MDSLLEVLAVLGRADVGPGELPKWYLWIALGFAHAFIGIGLSLVPRAVAWSLLGLLVAKELVFDLPGAGLASPVLLDSPVDVFAVLLGLWMGRSMQAATCPDCGQVNSGAGPKSDA